jgi:anti-sigma regulatory factor (Ser/Thr protein kinase)
MSQNGVNPSSVRRPSVDETVSLPHPARQTDRIDIAVPARAEYVAIVRLAAGGIAGRMALSFDDAEDLKLVVGEACNIAILAGATSVRVRFNLRPNRLSVRVTYDGDSAAAPPQEEDDLGVFVMRCLMDEVRTTARGGRHVIAMARRVPA